MGFDEAVRVVVTAWRRGGVPWLDFVRAVDVATSSARPRETSRDVAARTLARRGSVVASSVLRRRRDDARTWARRAARLVRLHRLFDDPTRHRRDHPLSVTGLDDVRAWKEGIVPASGGDTDDPHFVRLVRLVHELREDEGGEDGILGRWLGPEDATIIRDDAPPASDLVVWMLLAASDPHAAKWWWWTDPRGGPGRSHRDEARRRWFARQMTTTQDDEWVGRRWTEAASVRLVSILAGAMETMTSDGGNPMVPLLRRGAGSRCLRHPVDLRRDLEASVYLYVTSHADDLDDGTSIVSDVLAILDGAIAAGRNDVLRDDDDDRDVRTQLSVLSLTAHRATMPRRSIPSAPNRDDVRRARIASALVDGFVTLWTRTTTIPPTTVSHDHHDRGAEASFVPRDDVPLELDDDEEGVVPPWFEPFLSLLLAETTTTARKSRGTNEVDDDDDRGGDEDGPPPSSSSFAQAAADRAEALCRTLDAARPDGTEDDFFYKKSSLFFTLSKTDSIHICVFESVQQTRNFFM